MPRIGAGVDIGKEHHHPIGWSPPHGTRAGAAVDADMSQDPARQETLALSVDHHAEHPDLSGVLLCREHGGGGTG